MNRVTNDDALFGYRLQLFDLAARSSVAEACRTMGVHRSTYYYWKRQVDRHGLEVLRPRERRRPAMPNQLPRMVEERILAFSIAHPATGQGALRAHSHYLNGEACASLPTASGAAFAATGSRRAPSASRSWPATAHPMSHLQSPAPSRTLRLSARASWSGWTASMSGACAAQPGRSGS